MTGWTVRPSRALNILVADDSRSMRQLLRSAFPYGGRPLRFVEAANGEEAVEAYSASRTDIVLLDVSMPGMDGITALQRIRGFDPDAFVIMISGDDSSENRQLCREAGASSFVRKPISQQVAHRILEAFAGRPRRPASVLTVDRSDLMIVSLKMGMDILRLPHRMCRAHSAGEALMSFGSAHFDLVFVDPRMQEADGLGVVAAMKAMRPAAYVVMFSDESTADAVFRARDVGADDYLLKSVDLEHLRKVWSRFAQANNGGFDTAP